MRDQDVDDCPDWSTNHRTPAECRQGRAASKNSGVNRCAQVPAHRSGISTACRAIATGHTYQSELAGAMAPTQVGPVFSSVIGHGADSVLDQVRDPEFVVFDGTELVCSGLKVRLRYEIGLRVVE